MRLKFLAIIYPLLLSILSAILLFLCFPSVDQGWLVWFGLVPLLLAINRKSSKGAFFFAYISGVLFFGSTFSWMFAVEGYQWLHHAILHLYLGIYFGIFGLLFRFVAKRSGIETGLFLAPFIWIFLEYFRSNLGFLSYPSTLLGHSQHQYYWVIQIAAFTGVYGISFLIVMVNSALTLCLLSIHQMGIKNAISMPLAKNRKGAWFLGPTIMLLAISLVYGAVRTNVPISGQEVKVSIVQGNIEQGKKWDPEFADYIMQTYAGLSQAAWQADKPVLIVWPEAATPGMVLRRPGLHKKISSLIKSMEAYFLLGSSEFPKFDKELKKQKKSANTVLFFSPNGKLIEQYLKIRLLPFGEYLPHEDLIPWSIIKIPTLHSHIPGRDFIVFNGPDFDFSSTICWETIYPDLVRQFVKNGAQFLVNHTNEAWFGDGAAAYQFLGINIFRAVENRVFVIRSGNSGVSCFIDPYGRIIKRVQDETGRDIFIKGVATQSIVPLSEKTIYTRYGDWLVGLSLCVVVVFLLQSMFRPVRKIPEEQSS